MDAAAPLPVTIVGGYLGAGKTTLVNHLLRHPDGRRIAVLVNDFGDIAIDADLIDARDGDLIALAGGCVCCSFGSDLLGALERLAELPAPPERLLIETSGVALPGALARTLTLAPRARAAAIVVLADAETLEARLDDRYVGDTVRAQLAEADLVLLNKADLAGPAGIARSRLRLAALAPRARASPCVRAAVPAELVFGIDADGVATRAAPDDRPPFGGPRPAPASHAASAWFASISLELAPRVDVARLAAVLTAPAHGVLRAKGLLRDIDGTPVALQVVGARAEIVASGHADPDRGRLVCIGARGALDGAALRAAIAAAVRTA
ncbi:MAG: GTP-binding protein [Burkholderiales bacterium]|nr:GTP-binding protein [Burkholderiales bacterium]